MGIPAARRAVSPEDAIRHLRIRSSYLHPESVGTRQHGLAMPVQPTVMGVNAITDWDFNNIDAAFDLQRLNNRQPSFDSFDRRMAQDYLDRQQSGIR